jgi:L,D-transpeptidase catalytic domain/Putative peptidoglycan binding domain
MAKRPPAAPQQRNPWLPAIAAGCVLAVVVIAGVSGGGQGDASTPTTLDPALGAVESSLSGPVVTQDPIVTDSSSAPVVKTTFVEPIAKGSFGSEVKQLQQRLKDLGFAPGPVDGQFGTSTQQAVWAWKKLVGGMTWQDLDYSNSATVVTPELWQEMQDPVTIQPRRPQAAGTTHVEIYLPLQVLAVFTDNKPTLIAHVASGELDAQGNPVHWCEVVEYNTDNEGRALEEPVVRDECAYSKTPGGVFKFTRRYEGNRLGPLGGMYNPVYFNYGIAVHGAREVPTHPASHGCIRLNMDIAEFFPSLVSNRDLVFVWGHDGKEPEYYSKEESKPSFNAPNPDSTTTSSSSTTSPVISVESETPTTKPATPTTKPAPNTTVATTTTVAVPTTVATPTTLAPVTSVPVP